MLASKSVKSKVKTLSEVCEFQNGKVLSKNNIVEGEISVIGGGKQPFDIIIILIQMKIQFYVQKVVPMSDILVIFF